MSPRRAASFAFAATVAFALTGCLSPHLKRAGAGPGPAPTPALVSGFSVQFDDTSENKSAIEAALDMSQNSQLEVFGQRASDMLAAALGEHGYTVGYDGNRTARLDEIRLASSSTAAAFTGIWRHPEAALFGPERMEGLFVKPSEVISRIRLADRTEHFAFTSVLIRDYGIIMRSPCVIVRTTVFDQEGKKVLDLQGIGWGDSQFMYADRSPENLQTALQRGFESLKTVTVETL